MTNRTALLGLAGLAALGAAITWWPGRSRSFESPPGVSEKPADTHGGTPAADPAATSIAAALRSPNNAEKDAALQKMLPELVRRDPRAAARLAESLESWAWREDALHQVARGWAQQDFPAAAKWAVKLRDPQERKTALNDACIQAAERDPAAAVAQAERFRMDEDGDTVMANLVQVWGRKDYDAARTWLDAQPAGESRDHTCMSLAMVRAASAPEEAAALAVERIAPGPVQEEAVIAVVHQWTLHDPEGAAAWVDAFPQGALQDRARQELNPLPR